MFHILHISDSQAPSSTPSKASVAVGRPRGSVIDLTEDEDHVQGKADQKLLSSSVLMGICIP